MSQSTRQSTDNSHFELKLEIRRRATEGLKEINVLDLYAGENRLWSTMHTDRYYGVDIQRFKGLNVVADNARVLEAIDLRAYNVLDMDAYGVPDRQIGVMFRNRTLQAGTRVVFTSITGAMNGTSLNLCKYYGLTRIYQKAKTMVARQTDELFLGYLYDHGIKTMWGYIIPGSMRKTYAWFIIPDPVTT